MYEIFEKLLKENKITIYKFCKDTGVPESTVYTWKKKNTKCNAKLQKIVCDYFGISSDYLMTGQKTENDQKYYINDETASIAQDIFENKELRLLFDAARDADPEDLEAVHTMLLALKRKERGNID